MRRTGVAGRGKSPPSAPASAPAVLVREIDDARAAAAAAAALGRPVILTSPAFGAASLGAGWWQAMMRIVAAEHPGARITAVLDCGDRADLIQAALRQGLTDVAYRGPPATARRLGEIAGQCAARLHRRLPKPLDLAGVSDRQAACRAWLSKAGERTVDGALPKSGRPSVDKRRPVGY